MNFLHIVELFKNWYFEKSPQLRNVIFENNQKILLSQVQFAINCSMWRQRARARSV